MVAIALPKNSQIVTTTSVEDETGSRIFFKAGSVRGAVDLDEMITMLKISKAIQERRDRRSLLERFFRQTRSTTGDELQKHLLSELTPEHHAKLREQVKDYATIAFEKELKRHTGRRGY